MHKTTVLAFGAGTFQKGLIKYLQASGYVVYTIGNLVCDPGINDPKRHINENYLNEEAVLTKAKELNVIQVLSVASDATLEVQSVVRERLGFKTHPLQFSGFFTDKWNYKQMLLSSGLKGIPDLGLVSSSEVLIQAFQKHKGGLLIKPRKGSGSLGVRHIRVLEGLNEVTDFTGQYLWEEFVSGQEFGGDFLLLQGEVIFYYPTLKGNNGYNVPISHLVLKGMSCEQKLITEFLSEIINHVSLQDGVYNVDVIIEYEQPYLIDLSPRMGGNCIPDLMNYSWGMNEWQFLTEFWLEEQITPVVPVWSKPHGVYIIGADKNGVFETSYEEHFPYPDHLAEVYWRVKTGDDVEVFRAGSKHLGYVIYFAETDELLLDMQSKVESFEWFSLIEE